MKGTRSIALATAVVAVGAASISPALAAPSSDGAGQAIVTVSTPELPSGQSVAARERWKQLRAVSSQKLGAVADRNDLRVVARTPEIGQLVVDLGAGGIAALRERLASDPSVERVLPNSPVQLRYAPNDPGLSTHDAHAPAGDFFQWPLGRYGAARAWDFSKGAGSEVAIVDTGVDAAQPDLGPRIVAADDLDNGLGDAGPTTDTNGHGTHVAGLACADTDNGYGIASLGFDCNLFVVKVALTCAAVSQGIVDAANRFSDAINLSLGGCPNNTLNAALNYAWGRGSVPVVAGDNQPQPDPNFNYPAEFVQPVGTGPSLDAGKGLVVTAANYAGNRAVFAQRDSGVSVGAIGAATDIGSGGQQGILSTFPQNSTDADKGMGEWSPINGGPGPCGCRTTLNNDNRFAYLVGTSMSTPQVSGLVALMRAAKPTIAASQVVRLIKLSASNCGTYGSNGLGWGLIRADRAVAAAAGKDIDAPGSQVLSAKRGGNGIINLRLKRFDISCSKELPTVGVKSTAVFASTNNGPFHRIGKTKKRKLHFRGKPGRRYSFFSIAVDKDGNRESPPALPDVHTRLKRR
jgi:subtilisin family serine protease